MRSKHYDNLKTIAVFPETVATLKELKKKTKSKNLQDLVKAMVELFYANNEHETITQELAELQAKREEITQQIKEKFDKINSLPTITTNKL